MSQSRARYDVIVVGGGHNGLVAATYLARAGRSVLVLERNPTLGGAVASAAPFPGVPARLSRYSYLVSLVPDRLVRELGLTLRLRSRRTASYTPVERGGRATGLLVERDEGALTEQSFRELTGSAGEYAAWRRFYAQVRTVAEALAPTLLEPLPGRVALREQLTRLAGTGLWDELFERPIGAAIESRFADDLVRGVVLTDALIGTHTRAHDPTLLANRVFLYHLVGNGTGEWRVPVGGMGAVAAALEAAARAAGTHLITDAAVTAIDADSGSVAWTGAEGEQAAEAGVVLANVAPATLARLRGQPVAPVEGSQLKVNMMLRRLPRMRSGADPRVAFAGTFHIDEGYAELDEAFGQADSGRLPERLPSEIYCHTLTDPSILAPELAAAGGHTLTLFGLHVPSRLITPENNDIVRAEALRRALAGLDRHLAEPIADCLMLDADGRPCVEARTPLDLERELGLPGGNIFHGELQWPFREDPEDGDPWGVATDSPRLLICGSGARRGGAVSGIAGHNAARAVLERSGR